MGSSSEWNIPFTPLVRARWAISDPSLRVLLSPFMTPAKPGRRTAMTLPLSERAPLMTLDSQSAKMSVTSSVTKSTGLVPLPLSMSLTRISILCLATSFLT